MARLDASLAEDVLSEAYTNEEIAQAICEAGGDSRAIGLRGVALAARLLTLRRLDRQEAAQSEDSKIKGAL